MNPDQRRIVVLYALAGADAGVVLTMLHYSQPGTGQTDIGVGMQLTVLGTILGVCLGSGLSQLAVDRPKAAGRIIGYGVVLLTALLGISVGWMTAAVRAMNGSDHDELTRRWAPVGGMIGAGVGLVALIPRWFRHRSPRSSEPGA